MLFFISTINLNTIILGIIGTDAIKPYTILILFMSLAYISLSIDATGAFEYIAFKMVKFAGNSGLKLFVYVYFLSSFLTIFTSNDIVILTLTPIIIYFCKFANINPIPFIISQFFAANIWSIALYIGNPTNIIVAQAYELSFLGYIKWSIFPTITAGLFALLLLWLVFRKIIPKKIELNNNLNNKALIRDKYGAIFGVIILFLCLLTLSLSTLIGIELWIITLFFAGLMLIYHVIYKGTGNKPNSLKINYFKILKARMPWKIIPFTLGMFILVESLVQTGWIALLATSISNFNGNLFISIMVMGFLSALSCNVMNNQPMTIFFTQVLRSESFMGSQTIKFGNMFSLIIGSNLGANLTLIGALAGIMWYKIARDKDVALNFKDFAKFGFKVMPPVILIVNLVLFLEIVLWF
ncbi:MAG: SLC13 family permease [Candidatus Thorarchaeota archaeon]